MLQRLLIIFLLLFSPALSALSINVNSSLDTFEYDLENIHLKLEKLDASWQMSPFNDKKLVIDKLRAKRLVINVKKSAKTNSAGLPEHVLPPFPIQIQQAEVTEIVYISAGESYKLSNVKFALDADTKSIKLHKLTAGTPWGETTVALNISPTRPFALSGVVALKQSKAKMPYDIKAQLAGNLQKLRYESTVLLAKQGEQFQLLQENQKNNATVAQIKTNGDIGLVANYPVTVSALITELQPELLGNYPAAKLNLNLTAQGKLLPQPALQLQYATHDSQWQNHTFESSGKVFLEGTKIRNFDAQANLASNSITANGSLDGQDGRILWQADLPDLSALSAHYSGAAKTDGELKGSLENWELRFNLAAQKLHLPQGLKAEKLTGSASITAGEHGNVAGELNASHLQYGKMPVVDGHMTLQGTRDKHQLHLLAHGDTFNLEGSLHGGLNTENRWHGLLQKIEYKGKTSVKLAAPAPLAFDANSVTLNHAALQFVEGHAEIQHLQIDKNGFISKGNLGKIGLKNLETALSPIANFNLPPALHGNALFAGKWDVSIAESINGQLSFWRESGDLKVTMADGSVKSLGLQETKAELTIVNNQATLVANTQSGGVADLKANLATTLTKTDSGFTVLTSAPFTMNGTAQLSTLAWLPLPASLIDASIDGSLSLTVAANGTLGAPNLSGNVSGKNLNLAIPIEGVNFTNGVLEASFENSRLRINKASWQGGEGYLSTTGLLLMEAGKPKIDLDWTANQFTAISRADRLLILNGTGKTVLTNDMLTISGNVKVVRGLIELASELTPTLGDDVIIVGQAETTQEHALQVLLNGLRIDVGNDFRLRGYGLDAQLIGAVTLTGLTQYSPHTEGSIQVENGTFSAYGQKLSIDRGIVNFSGAIGNPGINIRAMRNSEPVNAGVEITGTVLLPVTKLVSEPNVSDSDKLAWLVLGHGLDQTSKNDYALLSLATSVVFAQDNSVPPHMQIANAVGIDDVNIIGSDSTNTGIAIGKRLSSKLYLSYQKSANGLLDVARLTLNMTPRWSLRGEAGTESAVDVLYTFSYK